MIYRRYILVERKGMDKAKRDETCILKPKLTNIGNGAISLHTLLTIECLFVSVCLKNKKRLIYTRRPEHKAIASILYLKEKKVRKWVTK